MRMLAAAPGEVIGLGFSPTGDALAAVVAGRGVFLWNLLGGSPLPVRLDEFNRPGMAPHFAPDGRSLTWLGPNGPRTYDRDARSTTETGLPAGGRLLALTVTPDGGRMVSQHNWPDAALVGWRAGAPGWQQEWSLPTTAMPVYLPTLTPAGDRVAFVCREIVNPREWQPFQVQVRSAVSGVVKAVRGYPYNELPGALTFSPDGAQLVAVCEMTLLVWPAADLGAPRLVRNDTRKHFTAIAFHPAGRHLFATSNDTTVHVFDALTWDRAGRYTWNVGRLRSVAVSPDGTVAAAGGDAGEVVVWDLDG